MAIQEAEDHLEDRLPQALEADLPIQDQDPQAHHLVEDLPEEDLQEVDYQEEDHRVADHQEVVFPRLSQSFRQPQHKARARSKNPQSLMARATASITSWSTCGSFSMGDPMTILMTNTR